MPKPTVVQLFGAGAQVISSTTSITATAADPALVIRFSAFTAVGWQTVAGTTDPEKWLAAMLLQARGWYNTNNDQVPNIAIADPFPGLVQRNNRNAREFSYQVSIYETDTGATAPDPDNV